MAVIPYIFLPTDSNKLGFRFQDSTIFFPSSSVKFIFKILAFQATAQTLFDIIVHKTPLNFPLYFCFDNLTFVTIYCCAMLQTLSKLHEHELFSFVKKCESTRDKLIVAEVHSYGKFLHDDDTRILFMLTIFIRSLCDNYLIMNWKCQGRSSDVIRCVT